VNHIGDANKMVSDTPISDSTPHNVAELGMLCRRLERKLSATRKYLSEVTERVEQLETENDAMRADLLLWREQEAKP
jgi:HPt (histidine-containing phosphotransfer) domain-containing protein